MKKAQGLPLNVIIVAIIVLIVLVVLIVIFTTKTGRFAKAAESCATRGGDCAGSVPCEDAFKDWVATETKTEDCEHCCIKLYKK